MERLEDFEPDEFFVKVSQIKEEDSLVYPLMASLGSSLCTIYNSSSPAERDFSLMNSIVEKRSSSTTSQLLLETKMHIKAEVSHLSRTCTKCQTLSRQERQSRHCHCHQWIPTEDLLVTVRNGAARARYMKEIEDNRKEEEDRNVLKEIRQKDDSLQKVKDFKEEVMKLRVRIRNASGDKSDSSKRKRDEDSSAPRKKNPSNLFSAFLRAEGKEKKSSKS